MDEVLHSRRRHIEYVVVAEPERAKDGPTPTAPVPPASQTQQELTLRRTRRGARWDEVRAHRAAGYSIQRIAREMGITVEPSVAIWLHRRFRATDHPTNRGHAA
jgi:hypothetical protein